MKSAQAIEFYLRRSGLNQAQLGDRSGVSAPMINAVIRGKKFLGPRGIRLVGKALALSPVEELGLYLETLEDQADEDERHFLTLIRAAMSQTPLESKAPPANLHICLKKSCVGVERALVANNLIMPPASKGELIYLLTLECLQNEPKTDQDLTMMILRAISNNAA